MNSDTLRPGDLVIINFSGISDPPPRHEERIKQNGTINLTHIGEIQAAGKTRRELEEIIERKYVPKYFARLTVRVAPELRFIYVDGEVAMPQRLVHQGEMTVMKAIAAAGGFTSFANRRKVKLTRADGSKPIVVNCKKANDNPKYDLPIYPDDRIYVERRYF